MDIYKTKDTTVKAIRFDGRSKPKGVVKFCTQWLVNTGRSGDVQLKIKPGDWILVQDGINHVIKDDLFNLVFERKYKK